MANTARKVQPTQVELDLADIAHALCVDTTRAHLCRPFGVDLTGAGAKTPRTYLGATDGHRMALVRSPQWYEYKRDDAPPAAYVVPWDAPWVGELNARALDDSPRVFPRSWDVALSFGFGTYKPALHVSIRKGSGKKERTVRPFGPRLAVDWGEGSKLECLQHELAINLQYLLDAVDFCGTGVVKVFNGGPLAPIVFVPAGAKSIAESLRVAVVMPRRQ